MDRVSAELTSEQKETVLTKLREIREIFGFCINLSPEERRVLPKMGPRSIDFVNRASDLVSANPKMMPQDFDVEEFQKDVNLIRAMDPVKLELDALVELFDDTYIEVGSEAYVAALEVYRIAKARGKAASLDNVLDALGKRFARKIKSDNVADSKASK